MRDENPKPVADQSDRPTPLKAVRRDCLDCCNGSSNEVSLCTAKACPLWPFRFGRRPTPELLAEVAEVDVRPLENEQTGADVAGRSALKSIKARCIDCSGGSKVDANACTVITCDLHPYRTGKSGNTLQLTDEQRAVRSKRMRDLHNKRRDAA